MALKENFDGVTTLIGASLDSKAELGVIGKYFYPSTKEWQTTYNPTCYFGISSYPKLYKTSLSSKLKQPEEFKPVIQVEPSTWALAFYHGCQWPFSSLNVVLSGSKTKVAKLADKLGTKEYVVGGGCGNRLISVLEGKKDLYCNLGAGDFTMRAVQSILLC